MTSFSGSVTNFNGDPSDDGPTPKPRFIKRGDPEVLLGERGGALPVGNMEGLRLGFHMDSIDCRQGSVKERWGWLEKKAVGRSTTSLRTRERRRTGLVREQRDGRLGA